jgi:hypothetical protein
LTGRYAAINGASLEIQSRKGLWHHRLDSIRSESSRKHRFDRQSYANLELTNIA